MDTTHVKAIMRTTTTTATDVSTQLRVTLTSIYGDCHTRSQMLQKKIPILTPIRNYSWQSVVNCHAVIAYGYSVRSLVQLSVSG